MTETVPASETLFWKSNDQYYNHKYANDTAVIFFTFTITIYSEKGLLFYTFFRYIFSQDMRHGHLPV
jgi:hypothetical protein